MEEVTQLRSSQEEDDTHMLLHGLHAAESGYKAAITIADDTDVLVLWFQQGHPMPYVPKMWHTEQDKFSGQH